MSVDWASSRRTCKIIKVLCVCNNGSDDGADCRAELEKLEVIVPEVGNEY